MSISHVIPLILQIYLVYTGYTSEGSEPQALSGYFLFLSHFTHWPCFSLQYKSPAPVETAHSWQEVCRTLNCLLCRSGHLKCHKL